MTRYFHTGPMPKVGSVAHTLYGLQAPQYVKAETFDDVVEERNALQALAEWQAEELRRANVRCGLLAGLAVVFACGAWALSQLLHGVTV